MGYLRSDQLGPHSPAAGRPRGGFLREAVRWALPLPGESMKLKLIVIAVRMALHVWDANGFGKTIAARGLK